MRAPVYRSIDSASTFLGLAFPTEVLLVLAAFWGTIIPTTPGVALLATGSVYAFLRLGAHGKPPQHLQHLLMFHARRAQGRGRFLAAARAARQPRFPHAPTHFRDGPVTP